MTPCRAHYPPLFFLLLLCTTNQFYELGNYWGNKVDPTGFNEDCDHNEMYFDQFMAFFGSSMLADYFVDITQAI